MTGLGRSRLTLFVSILVVFAVALYVVSGITAMSPIALAPAYMFSPMIAGLVVCIRRDIPLSAVGLRIGRVRWLAVATVVALPLVGLILLIAVAVPDVGFDPTANPTPGLELPSGVLGVIATFGLVLGLGATVNAVFAFGAEFGWRGDLLWELAPWGFGKASVAIGALWGVWYAPIIVAGYNYPSFAAIAVVAMTIACSRSLQSTRTSSFARSPCSQRRCSTTSTVPSGSAPGVLSDAVDSVVVAAGVVSSGCDAGTPRK